MRRRRRPRSGIIALNYYPNHSLSILLTYETAQTITETIPVANASTAATRIHYVERAGRTGGLFPSPRPSPLGRVGTLSASRKCLMRQIRRRAAEDSPSPLGRGPGEGEDDSRPTLAAAASEPSCHHTSLGSCPARRLPSKPPRRSLEDCPLRPAMGAHRRGV